MAQLRATVQAPPARPPRYGLLAAAPTVDDPDMRWAGGWAFEAEGCGMSGRAAITCAGSVTDAMVPAATPGIVEGDPIWLWAADECSTFGFAARDWQARARRQLAATESYELANELWEGTVSASEPEVDNRALAGAGALSDTVTNGAADEVLALACVESALAELLKGQQGMIHMTTQLLTVMRSRDVVQRDGNVWATPNGHIVVADAGYTGSGPASVGPTTTSQWIYGTPLLSVRLGPVETIPGSLDEAKGLAAAMDRAVNTIAVYAGRLAGVQWPNECAHVAAEVDVGVCLIGGAS